MSYNYVFEITNGTETGGTFSWDGTQSAWSAFAWDEGSLTATGQPKSFFNLNPPSATGTSPGRFRPGVNGVINLPDQDIDVGGEPSSSAHIVFTNNVWTTSHSSSGYVWTITRSLTPNTNSEEVEVLNGSWSILADGTHVYTIGSNSPTSSTANGLYDVRFTNAQTGAVTRMFQPNSINHTFGTATSGYISATTNNGKYELIHIGSSLNSFPITVLATMRVGKKKLFSNFW